ncbi:hypothetical protein L1887_32909 [Cichorium endivia]|nr:hypothetical protein L1887_32909 [Cichorium endivia]
MNQVTTTPTSKIDEFSTGEGHQKLTNSPTWLRNRTAHICENKDIYFLISSLHLVLLATTSYNSCFLEQQQRYTLQHQTRIYKTLYSYYPDLMKWLEDTDVLEMIVDMFSSTV